MQVLSQLSTVICFIVVYNDSCIQHNKLIACEKIRTGRPLWSQVYFMDVYERETCPEAQVLLGML